MKLALSCRVIFVLTALGAVPAVAAVDVREFGAVGDGKTKNTAAIQRAIDACASSGGGEVRVAGGTYVTGLPVRRSFCPYTPFGVVVFRDLKC